VSVFCPLIFSAHLFGFCLSVSEVFRGFGDAPSSLSSSLAASTDDSTPTFDFFSSTSSTAAATTSSASSASSSTALGHASSPAPALNLRVVQPVVVPFAGFGDDAPSSTAPGSSSSSSSVPFMSALVASEPVAAFDGFSSSAAAPSDDGAFFAAVAAKHSPMPPVRVISRAAEPLPTFDAFSSSFGASDAATDSLFGSFGTGGGGGVAPNTPPPATAGTKALAPSTSEVRAAIHAFVPLQPKPLDAPATPDVRAAIAAFSVPGDSSSDFLASLSAPAPASDAPPPVSRRLMMDSEDHGNDDVAANATGAAAANGHAADGDDGDDGDDEIDGEQGDIADDDSAASNEPPLSHANHGGDSVQDSRSLAALSVFADDDSINVAAPGSSTHDTRSHAASVFADDDNAHVAALGSSSAAPFSATASEHESVAVIDAFASMQDDGEQLLFASMSSVGADFGTTAGPSLASSFAGVAAGSSLTSSFVGVTAAPAVAVESAPVFAGFGGSTSPATVSEDVAFFSQIAAQTPPRAQVAPPTTSAQSPAKLSQPSAFVPQLSELPSTSAPVPVSSKPFQPTAFVPRVSDSPPTSAVAVSASVKPFQPTATFAPPVSDTSLSSSMQTEYSLAESTNGRSGSTDDPFASAFGDSSDSTFFDLAAAAATTAATLAPSSFAPAIAPTPIGAAAAVPASAPVVAPAAVSTKFLPSSFAPSAAEATTAAPSTFVPSSFMPSAGGAQPSPSVSVAPSVAPAVTDAPPRAPPVLAPLPARAPSGFVPSFMPAEAQQPAPAAPSAAATTSAFDDSPSEAFVLDLAQATVQPRSAPAAPLQQQQQQAPLAQQVLSHARPLQQSAAPASAPAPRASTITFSRDGRPAHAFGVFAFGGRLVKLSLDRTSRVSIVPAGQVLRSTPYYQAFARFPGPLVNAKRAAVVSFIDSAISDASDADPDRVLLWRVLRLMLDKQTPLLGNDDTLRALVALLSDDASGAPSALPPATAPTPPSGTLEAIQRHVVRGELPAAHALAVQHGVWQHALLLASHIGADAYRDTVARFSAAALPPGTPLRTFYGAMSGQAGATLKGEGKSELLAHWRANVAAILANHVKGAPALVGTIGDQLWAHSRRHRAAHVCYLITERPFGAEVDPNARIVLLGADHKVRPRFAVADPGPDAWRLSEVLSYISAQSNAQHNAPTLLHYRLLYAQLCADVGLLQQAQAHTAVLMEAVRESPDQLAWLAPIVETFRDRVDDLLGTRSQLDRKGSWLSLGGVLKQSTGVLNKFAAMLVSGDGDGSPTPGAEHAAPPAQQPQPQVAAQPAAATAAATKRSAPPARAAANSAPTSFTPATSFSPATSFVPSSFAPAAASAPSAPAAAAVVAPAPTPAPAATTQQQPARRGYMEDSDDEKDAPPPPRKAVAAPATPTPAAAPASPAANAQQPQEESGGGIIQSVFSIFGGGKKKVTQAKMGQQLDLEYNKELGIWHKKGEKPDASLLAGLAPPPTAAAADPAPAPQPSPAQSAPAAKPSAGAPVADEAGPGAGAPGPASMPPSDSANKFSKGRQRRHVDTFNAGVVHASTPSLNGLVFEKPAAAAAPAATPAFVPTSFAPSAFAPAGTDGEEPQQQQ
jgi:hypothetical protein